MYFQGRTALHLAASRKKNIFGVIQVLLKNGFKADIKDKEVTENRLLPEKLVLETCQLSFKYEKKLM